MKILITGGCGFVGSNLAIYFKNNQIGTQINSLDNLSRRGTLLNLNRLLRVQFIARHAYCIIKLAVKTSRPHYFNEQKNEGQIYKKLVHRI